MLAFAVALCFPTKLTLALGPLTADQFLEKLSPLVGERLVCSPRLKREVLMVKVDGVEWSELKGRIAKVAGAEWLRQKSDWLLERSSGLARAQQEKALERRTNVIKADIAEGVRSLKPWSPQVLNELLVRISGTAERYQTGDPSTQSRMVEKLFEDGYDAPAGRALRRVLPLLSPARLAAIPPDSMIVYSNRPTKMEQQLPSGADSILAGFLTEHKDYATEIVRRTDLFAPLSFLDPRFNVDPNHAPASRFILAVRRFGQFGLEAHLSAVDAEGWGVAGARKTFRADEAASSAMATVPALRLEFSDPAKEFDSLYVVLSGHFGGDLGDRDKVWRLSREWILKFSEPLKYEPMSFILGDGLTKTSKLLKANLVANLSDDLLTYVPMLKWNKSPSTRTLLQDLVVEGRNMTGSVADGWIELQPRNAGAATEDRLDRASLGRLMRAIESAKCARLDDLGDYAAAQPGDLLFRSLDEVYASMYSRNMGTTGAGHANYYYSNILRFWGALTPPQRKRLRDGGSLQAMGLSEPARHWLTVYVYGIPRVMANNFVTPYTLPPLSSARRNAKASPYEGMPTGVPLDTIVSGAPVQGTMLRVKIRDQDETSSDPENLAFWFANQGWPLEGEKSPLISVSVGIADMVKITFDFGRGYSSWTKLGDDVKVWSEPFSYANLPEDIRKRIEDRYAVEVARKAQEDAKIKGRTIPPTGGP